MKLTKPVPVYFAYISAWGMPDGSVQFGPDIYDQDGAPSHRFGLLIRLSTAVSARFLSPWVWPSAGSAGHVLGVAGAPRDMW